MESLGAIQELSKVAVSIEIWWIMLEIYFIHSEIVACLVTISCRKF